MTAKDYEDRIAAAQEKLQKIEKRIQKWEDNKSEEAFSKQYDWMHDDTGWQLGWGSNGVNYGTFEEFKAKHYAEWVAECDKEIKYANLDKIAATTLIDKYKNALDMLKDKDAKPVIQIFKDFFDHWKQEIKDYVKPIVEKYYELDKKMVDLYNYRYEFEERGFKSRDELEDELDRLGNEANQIKSESIVGVAIDKGFHKNEVEFNKYLDDYMNHRYFELVDKVTAIVGNIDDISDLHVGVDGTLNGRIFGDKGGAKLETIVAGGYNTDVIVNVKHGQCRHYRVLVHPIK